MRAYFEMCYMVIKFPKRILRPPERHIRIERIIHEFSYVENLVKRRKYPIRISAYMI
jgi:hypothetical protein